MAIDWLSATHEDRRRLYRHVKRVVDRHYGGDWSRFYADIPTHVTPRGHGDQDNFRAGRISRKRAAAIYDWITAHHPYEAAAITDTASPFVATTDWESFLRTHGEESRLRVVPLDDPSLTIVAFAARRRVERLSLGEPFCFALDSAFAGEALALQQVDGKWYSLPLREDSMLAPIISGDQFLPRDIDTDRPIPLTEDAHLGNHSFVFLTWGGELGIPPFEIGQPVAPDRLNHLARSLAQAEHWAVHRLDVLFTP
jgi:hypothetical protein